MKKELNKMWQKAFPGLDFTEYHANLRRKPIKKMSLAEFIVFSREGFLLLYPARYWLIASMGIISFAIIEPFSFLGVINILIIVWAIYKTNQVVQMIKRLPDSTVLYDVEIREEKIFGVENNGL